MLAVAAPAGTTTTATATTCGKLLPPSWGSYLGAFADLDAREMYGKVRAADGRITAFEQLSRHKLGVVSISQQWDRGLRFPRERVLTIWRHGAVPYIAFLPASGVLYGPGRKRHTPEPRYTLQRITAGVFDRQLRAWADDARRLSASIDLRDPPHTHKRVRAGTEHQLLQVTDPFEVPCLRRREDPSGAGEPSFQRT